MSLDEERSGGCILRCGSLLVERRPPARWTLPLPGLSAHKRQCIHLFGVWPRPAYQGAGNLRAFKGRSFCPECGSRVASLREEEAEIMLGTLDIAPSDIIPGYELWIGRREPWLMDLQWAERFEHDREPRAIDAPTMEPEIPAPPAQANG